MAFRTDNSFSWKIVYGLIIMKTGKYYTSYYFLSRGRKSLVLDIFALFSQLD
jgi:hypothetical protein